MFFGQAINIRMKDTGTNDISIQFFAKGQQHMETKPNQARVSFSYYDSDRVRQGVMFNMDFFIPEEFYKKESERAFFMELKERDFFKKLFEERKLRQELVKYYLTS